MKNKVFFKTYGCAFNQFDSQIMKGKLEQNNFVIIDDDKYADLIVLNSCSVKNMSETKFFNDIKKYKEQNKKIIACGCIPQAEPSYLKTKLLGISTIGTNDLDNIVKVAQDTLNNTTTQILASINFKLSQNIKDKKEQLRLLNNNKRDNKLIQIIPINEGCLNYCTYCKTKQARGNLLSYSIETIKRCMQNSINQGAKEIYLTSQDTACYGFDINTNLSNLIKELLTIKGDYKIRIGMGNPHHFKLIIDDILELMKLDNRIYKFLHIPVQSGNNRILEEMRRMYSVEEYEEIILKAKEVIPKITIANDVIVAYPTETKKEFGDTIRTIQNTQTNVLNFSRFWLRSNTPAEKLYSQKDFIDGTESKRRAKLIKKEFQKVALNNNKKWIGWKGEVRIIEEGKIGTNSFIARNDYYKPIIIKLENKQTEQLQIGDIVNIEIYKITWTHFEAKLT